jgi:hypothetical protein
VVFSGELVEVRTPSGDSFSSMDPERFVFEVDVVYKGDALARQSVVTPREGASCGLELTGRGPFLVFASAEPTFELDGEDGELFSNLCTGSRALVEEVGVPVAFGVGDPPGSGASPVGSPDGDGLPVSLLITGAGMLVAAAAGAIVLVRRRTASGRLGDG